MKSSKFSIPARIRSFRYAFLGLWWMIRNEHNSWIYLVVIVLLIPACFLLGLSPIEWALIILCIGLVFSLELVNTAIEALCDKVSPEFEPLIGKVKDMAAAAVLITAIASAIVAFIILLPKFLLLFH